jgi:hypothetical protein
MKTIELLINGFGICVIIVLLFLIFSNNSKNEPFCNCSGLQASQLCVNPKLYPKDGCNEPPLGPEYIKKLYAENKLTEFTIPPKAGPGFESPMPYDQFNDYYSKV